MGRVGVRYAMLMFMEHPQQQAIYDYSERSEVAAFIPPGITSAVDVGCSRGGFSAPLRRAVGTQGRLIGVEAVTEVAAMAREGSQFDEVLSGYFPDVLEGRGEFFDLITFNDVLEHMVDPWAALRAARDFLTPEGHVLACIPNVQYAPVLWDLVRGRFSYTDDGVLDRTHLRFFTRASMVDLFEDAGYAVEGIHGVNNIVQDKPRLGRGHTRKLRHLLGSAQWIQYVVLARPER